MEKKKLTKEYLQKELEEASRSAHRYAAVADYLKFVLETFDLEEKEAPGTAGDEKQNELAQ